MDFLKSKTRENLMRAFAGESQARNRYTFAAEAAKAQGQYLLQQVFLYTAAQEKEHAALFWKQLQECSGSTVFVDGGYPVETSGDLLVQLQSAVHNETQEALDVYPAFARAAEEEGFLRPAELFRAIARIEQTHADRFSRFAELVQRGELFRLAEENQSGLWLCLNCGHLHQGPQAPLSCPVCSHEQGFFIRADLTPFRS